MVLRAEGESSVASEDLPLQEQNEAFSEELLPQVKQIFPENLLSLVLLIFLSLFSLWAHRVPSPRASTTQDHIM